MIAALISTVVFCFYTWQLASTKQMNSEYYGLFMVGICGGIMVLIVSVETNQNIASMVSGVILASFSIKSKLFHRELKIINTLKAGIKNLPTA